MQKTQFLSWKRLWFDPFWILCHISTLEEFPFPTPRNGFCISQVLYHCQVRQVVDLLLYLSLLTCLNSINGRRGGPFTFHWVSCMQGCKWLWFALLSFVFYHWNILTFHWNTWILDAYKVAQSCFYLLEDCNLHFFIETLLLFIESRACRIAFYWNTSSFHWLLCACKVAQSWFCLLQNHNLHSYILLKHFYISSKHSNFSYTDLPVIEILFLSSLKHFYISTKDFYFLCI